MMDIIHTVKLFIAAGIMGAAVLGVYHGLYSVISSNTLSTLAAIAAGGIVYVIAIVLIRAVEPKDVQGIPKIGMKLAGIIEKVSFKF